MVAGLDSRQLAELTQHMWDQPVDAKRIKGLTFGATVGATVTDLGTATDGQQALIRAGTTPYDFVALTYDATYGKWVSGSFPLYTAPQGPTASGSTSYVAIDSPSSGGTWGPLLPWRVLDTAGLTLQVRVLGVLDAGASSSQEFAAATVTGDANGALASSVANITGEVSHNTATQTIKDSGWVALNASVTVKDFLVVVGAHKRTGANNGNTRCKSTITGRWVG